MFKASTLDFVVPVFATLLSDQLLRVRTLNSDPLCRRASFVFVASNLELFWDFADAFRHVVNSLHRIYIRLVQRNSQILWLGLIARLSIVHFHFFAGCI